MEQRSVIAQTTRPETTDHTIKYKWMRYFFIENISSDNRLIVEMQQRALWIGLAFIFLALDEIDQNWYFPLLKPFGSLIPLLLIIGSFIAMAMALRPTHLPPQALPIKHSPKRWQRVILVLTLL